MIVSAVPANCVWQIEDAIRPLIKKLGVHMGNRFDEETLIETLKEGKMSLWISFNEEGLIRAFAATAIHEYPLRKVFSCIFCAGEKMDEWADDMMSMLMSYARDNGCRSIELTGRPGWTRYLKRYGFDFLCTTVEREL
jgi:hypothetical protein